MEKKNTGLIIGIIAVVVAVAVAIVGVGIKLTSKLGKASYEISEETATKNMNRLLSKVRVTQADLIKGTVDFEDTSLASSLPDIDEYELTVEGAGEVNIEIFVSPEKSGSGLDGWMNEAAEEFNAEQHKTSDGKTMSVSIRNISSGAAMDYIVSGKYVPDAYTPSNAMWGDLANADGADLTMVAEKLAGNVAGILVSDSTKSALESQYNEVNIQTVAQATIDGTISMGYTYPYTSSTGLNFLMSLLYSFDSNDVLSDSAINQFQAFQTNVPFVCYTTLQMRSAMESGSLDACVMEYQLYQNDSSLNQKYEFIPFGMRHDNPMYAVGDLAEDKAEVLDTFTEYCLSEEQQEKVTGDGFNGLEDYQSDLPEFPAKTLHSAQELWKKEKDSGRPVVAVFVADVSGSMDGDPLNRLKDSLINSSQYISSDNYIGLVSYSSDVTVNLPIAKFDLNQRSYFTGAVDSLYASGATCTYDAVLEGIKMLQDAKAEIPNAKLMLFVLSDGETNIGASFDDIDEIVEALDIPVYTIGYNADLDELGKLSSINEAATINSDTDDVVYKLGSLFNAQM